MDPKDLIGFTVSLYLENSSNPKLLRYLWIETFFPENKNGNGKMGDYLNRLENAKISRPLIQF